CDRVGHSCVRSFRDDRDRLGRARATVRDGVHHLTNMVTVGRVPHLLQPPSRQIRELHLRSMTVSVLPLDFLHGRGTLGYRRRMADRPYRFYASEISYFSGKVRPALRAKLVPYDEILPTTAAYREVIRPRTGLAMIPVVVTPEDETWQDSSDILDALEARFPEPAIVPATPVQRLVCYLVELYADEFLILPGLHY